MAFDSLPDQKSTTDNHALYLDALAKIEEINGDLIKAQDYYEQMTLLTNGKLNWGDLNGMSRYHLGSVYQQKGLNREAVLQYEKFLFLWKDANPGLPEVDDAKKRLAGLRGN